MSDRDELSREAALCAAPQRVMEMATAFCLSLGLDRDREPDPEAEELRGDAERLKENLHVVFSADMRREMTAFIRHLNLNRDAYRKSMLLWLDLVEGFAFEAELAYGDKTGPVKLRRVRGAVFYLVNEFTGGLRIPGVPRYLNRLYLYLMIRGTVEFVVTLVNADQFEQRPVVEGAVYERGLWEKDLALRRAEARREAARRTRLRKLQDGAERLDISLRVAAVKLWEPFAERCVNWLLDKLLSPPDVSSDFKRRADAVIKDIRAEAPDAPPVQTMANWFFDVLAWIGKHGKEIRASIDALAIAVNWTARMSDMTRERREELIVEAMIGYFDELGLRGPFFRFVVQLTVEINLEAILFLYEKRQVIPPAPSPAR